MKNLISFVYLGIGILIIAIWSFALHRTFINDDFYGHKAYEELVYSACIIAGTLSVIGAIGFHKNKKWGGVIMTVSSVGMFAVSGACAFYLLIGGGASLIFLPLVVIGFIIIQAVYLKRHWKELS